MSIEVKIEEHVSANALFKLKSLDFECGAYRKTMQREPYTLRQILSRWSRHPSQTRAKASALVNFGHGSMDSSRATICQLPKIQIESHQTQCSRASSQWKTSFGASASPIRTTLPASGHSAHFLILTRLLRSLGSCTKTSKTLMKK